MTREDIPRTVLKEINTYVDSILLFPTRDSGASTIKRISGYIPLIGGRLQHMIESHNTIRLMKNRLSELIKNNDFDVILFHGKSLIPLIKNIKDIPIAIYFCDATSMRIMSRIKYTPVYKIPFQYIRYLQVRRQEEYLVKKSKHIAFVSRRDKEVILGPNSAAPVVTLGVDHAYWRNTNRTDTHNTIVFVGILNYSPNEDTVLFLIDEILPLVRRSIPDIKVIIVGRNPTPLIEKAASKHREVTITGFVDDVRPYLENATLAVIPMRYGSGVQNKVLEAMAMELPVVTTPLVADGLRTDTSPDVPLCIAGDARDFADKIKTLLEQKDKRNQLAEQGLRFVEQYYDWSKSGAVLEQMCLSAVSDNSP